MLRGKGDEKQHQGKNLTTRKPRTGEVVLIKEETTPQTKWKLRRITELITNNRRGITDAKVRLPMNQVGEFLKFVRRLITQLYPLKTHLAMEDNNTSVFKGLTKEIIMKADRNCEEEAPEEEGHLTMTTGTTVRERNEITASTTLKSSWKCPFLLPLLTFVGTQASIAYDCSHRNVNVTIIDAPSMGTCETNASKPIFTTATVKLVQLVDSCPVEVLQCKVVVI